MISDARRGHVSPGIYTEERDVTYAVKSLGITSLGLVGETLYGPAFENIEIKDWSEFVDYFGGTSPEKFKGTGLPKYELPYIAKSYLEESKRLNVVRVLGLSGYQAGPCWVLKTDDNDAKPIVIFRSKMVYNYNNDICSNTMDDNPHPVVTEITLGTYSPKVYDSVCYGATGGSGVALNNKKKFAITVKCAENMGYASEYTYNVSLDPKDSDYIYKVLSSRPDTGNTPVYVEAVYESSMIGSSLNDFVLDTVLDAANLTETVETFRIFEVKYLVDGEAEVVRDLGQNEAPSDLTTGNTILDEAQVPMLRKGDKYYSTDIISGIKYIKFENTRGERQKLDEYNNYCEMYRPAQTPWFVSEAFASEETTTEGEGESATTTTTTRATMKKLFKFITISDGDAANYQVKVTIQKINPYKGTFDVVIRDFNDTDETPVILERFVNCNLTVGDSNFIGVKIGTSDGAYESKSKYITVVMANDEDLSGSVPCGFLGFPMPDYGCGEKVIVDYNTKYDPTIRPRKQYFGLNNEIIDTDILKYKGVETYDENGDIRPEYLTSGFHMDSALKYINPEDIIIDGVMGYSFVPVSDEAVTNDAYAPRIMKAEYMNHTIYKDELLRKFTTYFYGGFDGWDVNRTSRTNTDEYKATNYAVTTSNGKESGVFTKISYNGLNEVLNLPATAITSDYYAYLAGYRVFANPQDIDINLFATPGINWYNHKLLTLDAIDMIEDSDDGRGGDALYIMDSPANMSPDEIAAEFEDSDIDTSYACTYYPWIMYFDKFNNQYINIPPTKDVVRNIAMTDNNSHPWFAPAGIERGSVNCVKADFKTTLAQEDVLYENRINPVKTFGKDGVKIWGNKTAYSTDSPLNRINVRRLMIRVKKLISTAARNLIFEQYSNELDKQFKGMVEPILAEVKSNKGIYDYKVITESTPETRDQHILPAKILIKPTPALEYISISFVVYPESVDFQD